MITATRQPVHTDENEQAFALAAARLRQEVQQMNPFPRARARNKPTELAKRQPAPATGPGG